MSNNKIYTFFLSWFQCTHLRVFLYGLIAGLPFTLIKYSASIAFCAVIGFSLFLYQLMHARRPRQAFAWGWVFGLGYHMIALHWVVMALSVDWEKFWWLAPFALVGIPAFLSVYIGFIAMGVQKTPNKNLKYLAFCIGWILMEIIRGKYILAFPWNLLGHIWVHSSMIQLTSYIGIYGLTSLSIFIVCLPVLFFKDLSNYPFQGDVYDPQLDIHNSRDKNQTAPVKALALPFALFCLFLLFVDYGLPFYSKGKTQHTFTDHVVHIVQPNILQSERWDSRNHVKNFAKTLSLSHFEETDRSEFIIWPESGMDFYLEDVSHAQQLIKETLKPNQILLTGALRREHFPLRVFNSLLAINHKAEMVHYYDKTRLLPYGEYIPGRRFMPSQLVGIAAGTVDFSPGNGLKTMRISNFPSFSPLICFEGVFSGESTVPGDDRPDFLLSTANDAWFGDTAGPYQHLHIVRIRAIEEGIPIVRASNSGISAIIAPNGEILESIPLHERGTKSIRLPQKYPRTFFNKWFS